MPRMRSGDRLYSFFKRPKLALDSGATPVEVAEPLGRAGNERVAAVGLDPLGRGLALTRGAAPLGRLALEVRSGERPDAMLTGGRLDGLLGHEAAAGDDREHVALGAGVVDGA